MPKFKFISCLIFLSAWLYACQSKVDEGEEEPVETVTPVTFVHPAKETLTDYIELSATSTMLQKSVINANINGYVRGVNTQVGAYVSRGQVLFTLKTKEAESIGDAINKLDPSFKFSGISNIRTSMNGYVTEMNHQLGDYVQDGEQLAVISTTSSFAFLMNLPYELRNYVLNKKSVELSLPDGEKFNGIITSGMPSVDSISQTQPIILKVNSRHPIPENLVATVKVVKSVVQNATVLPKQAVLADETETSFWIMKMINDSTAEKLPVIKGLVSGEWIEIQSPVLHDSDRVLVTGNYGLPDKAKVKVVKEDKPE